VYHYARSTGGYRLPDVVVPVKTRTAERKKKLPTRHGPGIDAHPIDLDSWVTLYQFGPYDLFNFP
jgi:hypothetical protein